MMMLLNGTRSHYKWSQTIYGDCTDHPSILSSMHQLGSVAQANGNCDDAAKFYELSLAMGKEYTVTKFIIRAFPLF